jgi:hypothetical protein
LIRDPRHRRKRSRIKSGTRRTSDRASPPARTQGAPAPPRRRPTARTGRPLLHRCVPNRPLMHRHDKVAPRAVPAAPRGRPLAQLPPGAALADGGGGQQGLVPCRPGLDPGPPPAEEEVPDLIRDAAAFASCAPGTASPYRPGPRSRHAIRPYPLGRPGNMPMIGPDSSRISFSRIARS